MMEVTEEEKKFSCKVCERSFTSYDALGRHKNSHSSDKRKRKFAYGDERPDDLTPNSKMRDVSGDLKRKAGPAYGNEETEDLTPKSKLKFDLNKMPEESQEIDLNKMPEELQEINLNKMPDSMKNDIPEFGTEEAARKSEEKKQIKQAAKPEPEADVSLTDLKTIMYECNTCYRTFESQQALEDHLADQTSDSTCAQDIESTAVVPRFNCDGYILKSNYVGWATRRRSVRVVISELVNRN